MNSDLVRELFNYDENTGKLYWSKFCGRGRAGKEAGTIKLDGYRGIMYARKGYYAHRLIWLYVYGVYPQYTIDHIDGNKDNNRIGNLRDIKQIFNNQNRKKLRSDNSLSVMGVRKTRTGKYVSSITTNGCRVHLGTFCSVDDAANAYVKAKTTHHYGWGV